MSTAPKRATIYLPAELHRAWWLEAAAADRSISELERRIVEVVKIGHRREV